MRYPILERTSALEILAKRAAGEEFSADEFVTYRGHDSDFDDTFIFPLKERLEEIRATFPQKLSFKSKDGGRFEAEACSYVHMAIPRELAISR